jgi:hypothetical protein
MKTEFFEHHLVHILAQKVRVEGGLGYDEGGFRRRDVQHILHHAHPHLERVGKGGGGGGGARRTQLFEDAYVFFYVPIHAVALRTTLQRPNANVLINSVPCKRQHTA